MERYKEYKDSGIDWIGEIPSHWEIMPIKSQGKLKKGLTFTKADLVEEGKSVISYGQIHSKDNCKSHLTPNLIRYIPKRIYKGNESSLVKKGSFIFADTSEDLEGCGNAVYNDSNEEVFAGYHTIIFERYDETGKYLAYLFQTDSWRSQIRSCVSGVKVYSITQSILSNTSIIFPPLSEQKEIADYLDKKCGEIDAAVEKVDKELELLDELKQSEISKAVTKGLNPNVSFKPSGIDWIGEIPSHWKIMPIKSQGNFKKGLTFTKADLVDDGKSVISYGQIHSKDNSKTHLTSNLIRYIPERIYKGNESSLVKKGSFIFADTSEDLEGCGNAVYNDSNEEVFAGYHTIIFERYDEVGKYLAYLFQTDAWRSQIRSCVSGVKVYSITQSILSNTSIIFPPLSEQKEIADYLDKKCGEIDSLKEKLKQKKEKLQELRQSLISEVVTGKRYVGTSRAMSVNRIL